MKLTRLLLLAAALLVVQWAGLLHGLSHGLEGHPGHEDEPPAACEWCLAYAVLDHGLCGQPPVPPPAEAPHAVIRACVPDYALTPRLNYHSRAPPPSLA
jgi:hypothetical protein